MQRTSAPSSPFRAPPEYTAVDRRTIGICAGAVVVAIGAGLAAQLLIRLIGFVTNATFFGRLSTEFVAPRFGTHNPLLIIAIPIGGAIIVGLMARYGSAAIRGHGIPEVDGAGALRTRAASRCACSFLKPLSAAIAIGTGGPFGAEGPIIATGGALGSLARPGRAHHRRRAQDAARRRRRGRHGGDLRQPGERGAARRRAAAVRIPAALAHSRRARRGRPRPRCASRSAAPRRCSRCRRSRSRRGAALMAYTVLGALIGVRRRR